MGNAQEKYRWIVDGAATLWVTAREHRGYVGHINRVGDAAYQLTIVGPSAPSPVSYATLRNAKNAYRKFLLDKPGYL